jgi:plastocyanin
VRSGKLVLLTAAVVLSCAAAGCGHTEHVGSDRTLRIAVNEYRLNPDTVSVNAGALTMVVRNYGRLTHNLVISDNGTNEGSTQPIPPGQTAVLTLTLGPGKYQMASTILSDQALGAFGTLTVTS